MFTPAPTLALQGVNAVVCGGLIAAITAVSTVAPADVPRADSDANRLPLTPFEVVSPYDPPAQDWLPGHRGIDVAAPVGESLVALADSTVHFAGPIAGRGVLTLKLLNGDLVSFEPIETELRTADSVSRGEAIGSVASAGQEHCTLAPCLHIGLRRNYAYLNPLILWGEVRPPIVLLPPV